MANPNSPPSEMTVTDDTVEQLALFPPPFDERRRDHVAVTEDQTESTRSNLGARRENTAP